MDKRLIKLAVIGLGHVSGYQLGAASRLPYYEITGVCDTDIAKKENIDRTIPFFTDYKVMLDAIECECVLISVPNKDHFRVCKEILECGRHVLLEKPATYSLDELRLLYNIADSKGVKLIIAYHAAFARDLSWFLDHYKTSLYDSLGDITGFKCGFYDPYIIDGMLLKQAESLGGSWLDSGVNALSVLGRLGIMDTLEIEDILLTKLPQFNCREVCGHFSFKFSVNSDDKAGRGIIDTNWTSGFSRKITNLYFAGTGKEIVLHHSNQQVYLMDKNGECGLLGDFANGCDRMINHYTGVFDNFYQLITKGSDNRDFSLKLHDLLLKFPK